MTRISTKPKYPIISPTHGNIQNGLISHIPTAPGAIIGTNAITNAKRSAPLKWQCTSFFTGHPSQLCAEQVVSGRRGSRNLPDTLHAREKKLHPGADMTLHVYEIPVVGPQEHDSLENCRGRYRDLLRIELSELS